MARNKLSSRQGPPTLPRQRFPTLLLAGNEFLLFFAPEGNKSGTRLSQLRICATRLIQV